MRAESTRKHSDLYHQGCGWHPGLGWALCWQVVRAQLARPVHQVQTLVSGAGIRASESESVLVCHLVHVPSTCATVSFTLSPADFTDRAFSQIFSLGPKVASETFLTLLFTGMTSPDLKVMPELQVRLLILSNNPPSGVENPFPSLPHRWALGHLGLKT